MTRLLLLSLVLVGSFAAFLARGLPQTARLERAWGALRQREREIEATRADVDLPGAAEYQALVARHARAQAKLDQRWSVFTDGPPHAAAPALAEVLDRASAAGLRRPAPLAEALLRDAAASPEAEASIIAIVRALPESQGLAVEELELRDGGRARVLPDGVGLAEVEVQLVLTGALADVLAALERFAPERGTGLPAVTVRSASLRRIEPERWGAGVRALDTPPVRLSATLAVIFAAPDGAG